MSIRLHMIFDPLCGWCYAVSPLLKQVQAHFIGKLPLVFHPGLLFDQPNIIPPSYREHIIAADQHIAALSGVTFGNTYLDRVRNIGELSYYSVPSATAVMSQADASGSAALRMLEKIQHAHYIDAADISDFQVLSQLAMGLGLSASDFEAAYTRAKADLPALAQMAHRLLRQAGAQGFPSFVLESQGKFQRLNHSVAYQDSTRFIAEIEQAWEIAELAAS
ncbi:MAG: DsbA family protein [Undibacterium umbellatum]|uniref:DsbA family protein n=1 Tax=Undibacterium umbellatum TaxID=2762300 RepID=UPI003BB64AE7